MIDIGMCGAFIAALRKENQLTQKQLAARIGVSDKAISRWETGKGLPDAASMLALSECFGVTINELLRGRRFDVLPSTEDTNRTMSDVLEIADREKAKRKRWLSACLTILGILTALTWCILLLNDIDGDGYSLSSVHCTAVARHTVACMKHGHFAHAAKHIGFAGQDQTVAEDQWIERMHGVFDDTLQITAFSVPLLAEDDQFIRDVARLEVYDTVTDTTFPFIITVIQQDGIAFGATKYIGTHHPERGDKFAAQIDSALGTYYAG